MRFTEISSSVVFASRFLDLPPRVAVVNQSKAVRETEPAGAGRRRKAGVSRDEALMRGSVGCILVLLNIVLAAYIFPAAEKIAEMAGVGILDSIWIGFVSAVVGLPVIGAVNLLILWRMKTKSYKVGPF